MTSSRVCCAALLACLGTTPLAGQARYFRLLDGRDGLTPTVVTAIAQDRDGLLWIGTAGGVFRYDGTRVERWARDRLDTWTATITVSPDGEIVVIDEKDGSLLDIVSTGVRDVVGPDGAVRGASMAAFDRSGGLWVSQGPRLIRREPGSSQWTSVPLDSADGTAPRILVALTGDEILVSTRKAVWRARPGKPPQWLADIPDLVSGLITTDGRILGITFHGELVEFGERVTRRPSPGIGRGIALVERNGTLWASFDRSLVAIGPNGGPKRSRPPKASRAQVRCSSTTKAVCGWDRGTGCSISPSRTRACGGPRSASPAIISGISRGSVIRFWPTHGRDLRRSARLLAAGRRLAWSRPAPGYRTHIDRAGGTWRGSAGGIFRTVHGRVSVAWPRRAYLRKIVEDAAGGIHVATDRGLLTGGSLDGGLTAVGGLPMSSDTAHLELAFMDRGGRLWIAGEGRVCARGTSPPPALRRSTTASDWSCLEKPAAMMVGALVETPSGSIWMVVDRTGVWRLGATGWEMIPGIRKLSSIHLANLVPSSAGGFWLVGAGIVMRVVEDTARADGWRVEERLTGWHGIPQTTASDVLEDPDGSLWIATMLGVVRVPASVRRERPAPPRVLLVEGSVDEDRIALDESVRLPFQRNRLRLRFAAVSFRDPLLVRYQVRALQDDEWETIVGTPEFRWVDLAAGQYRAEVRASLDGDRWSAVPASFAFGVLPPWYRSYWALLLFGSAIAAIAVLVHRARVAVHVELERQRMRIAMDLHDELGSGLGSIGILAGVLRSSSTGSGAVSDARQVASEIGSTAADLGTALSDIVWALDARSGGLEAIASRLSEHGNRLFRNGSARFATRVPASWPATHLDLATRRNILLIGVEALHNAARHSGAASIELHIETGPAEWSLEVIDDGIGLPLDAPSRGGMGLASMRRRAHQIRAHIVWLPTPGGGTTVRLRIPAESSRTHLPWRRPGVRRRARPPA